MLPLIASTAISAYSAYQASKGQKEANEQGMAYNAQEAQKQRDWEERMFASRYQTTRKDLEAAGYNPLMALGVNPGVPSGASAHFDPKSTKSESSRMNFETLNSAAQLALSRSQMRKVDTETRLTNAHADMAEQDANALKKMPWLPYVKQVLGSGLGNLIGGGLGGMALRGILGGTAKSMSGANYSRYAPNVTYNIAKGG